MSQETTRRIYIRLPESLAQQVEAEQKKRSIKHFATLCRLLIKERIKGLKKKKRQPHNDHI